MPVNCCHPNDVTPEWLTDVLVHAGFDAEIIDFSMTAVGTGQVGQSIRFDLQYGTGEGPTSMVGKFASDDPTSRQTGIDVGDYLKETLFYQQLLSDLDIRTPSIYFSAINRQQPDEFVLMMEDLAPAVQGDQLAGCGVDEASLALTELAGLAGPRWCDPSLRTLDWLAPPAAAPEGMARLWDQTFPGFLERYENRMLPQHVELVRHLGDLIAEYASPVSEAFTLVHVDYRLDNMMFGGKYPVAIVDWAPSLGNGASDAAYFMGTSLTANHRRQHEKPLITDYHHRLLAYGIDNYDFDACWLDYRRSSFAGLVMAVVASMIVGRTERGDDMFMVMAERSADMAIDLDGLAVLR